MCEFASRKGYESKTSYVDKIKEDINTIKEDVLDFYHSLVEPQPIFLGVAPYSIILTRRMLRRTNWARPSPPC